MAESSVSSLSPAKRALLEARLKGIHGDAEIVRRGLSEAPPTFAQERFWFLDRVGVRGAAYHSFLPLEIEGALHVPALEKAIGEVIRRHEALRTRFRDLDGRPLQVIVPFAGFSLPVEDLSDVGEAERQAEALRRARASIVAPFDLVAGPLVRMRLLRLDRERHLLAICMHHIVTDAWSWRIFLRELWTLYATPLPSLPPLPLQYADYAAWQREQWAPGEASRLLAYWRRQLAGAPALLALPTDHPRPAVQTYQAASTTLDLRLTLLDGLSRLARSEDATLYMVLLAGFQILLGRYTGSTDIIVGTPVAGRARSEVQDLVGLFINTVVMRTSLAGDPTCRELLRRVREVVLGAFEHQDAPFEQVVAELQPERSSSYSPLFQVVLTTQESEGPAGPAIAGLQVRRIGVDFETTKFDLTLTVTTHETGARAILTYNTALFERTTIERMARHVEAVLTQIATDPARRLSAIGVMDASERRQVLETWNQTERPGAADTTVAALVEAQAAAHPTAVAVIAGETRVTYDALNAQANQLARYLRRQGVSPETETRVAVCLTRGVPLVVGLLAVLKAGGAYVPLDPRYPSERLAYMLRDSGARVLVTETALLEQWSPSLSPSPSDDATRGDLPRPETEPNVTLVAVDDAKTAAALMAESTDNVVSGVTARHLAYVIYTSGSTGRPKGVGVEQGALANLLATMREAPGLAASDVLLAVTTVSFDIAGLELFLPLTTGATVAIAPREASGDPLLLHQALAATQATMLQATPATWRLLIDSGWPGDPRLIALCGGEALAPDLAAALLPRCGVLWNVYGPTETTIWSTCQRLTSAADVPIGRPVANTHVVIADAHGGPQPIGVAGELLIGGAGVARGYLGRPALTAERFVPDPYGPTSGGRLYRTGDRARWRADGTLLYEGRLDRQVKIRGFRIEPGEVEAALLADASVRAARVIVRHDPPGEPQLVAYVVADATAGRALDPARLRAVLRTTLPEYLVPAAIVPLDALPLTPAGKVDVNALPAPTRGVTDVTADPPQDFTEVQLLHIWEEVLGVEAIGPTQDYFELGGNSLLALTLFARIRQTLQCELPLAMLVGGVTVRQMAAAIREQQRAATAAPLKEIVPLQPHGSRPPLFCVHPAGRGASFYIHLVRHLGNHQPAFGVIDVGENLARPITQIASEHVRAMQAVQPSGPYHLIGWSFGGAVAYEIAVQLQRRHEDVAFLGVLDTMETAMWRRLPRRQGAIRVATLAKEIAEKMGRPFVLSPGELEALTLDEQCRRAVDALHDQHAAPPGFTAQHLRHDYYDVVTLRDRSRRAYKPRRFSGRLTLFRSSVRSDDILAGCTEEEARTLGWCRLVDDVQVHQVPGSHRSMGIEPHVRTLAQRVRESLDAISAPLDAVRQPVSAAVHEALDRAHTSPWPR
jgi:amino acid adenylation domain-containing protein